MDQDISLKSSAEDSKLLGTTKPIKDTPLVVETCEEVSELSSMEQRKPNEEVETIEDASTNTKFAEQQETSLESNFEHDLLGNQSKTSKITRIGSPLTKAKETSSKLERTDCEEHKKISERISKHDLTLELRKPNDKVTEDEEEIKLETKEDGLLKSEDVKGNVGEQNERGKVEAPGEKLTTSKQESNEGKTLKKRFTILHDDEFSDGDEGNDSMVALLRGTISELERALRDSRALIKTRDEDIVDLRREVEKGREQIHKEQLKWQRKCAVADERGREIQELKKKLLDSEKTVEELSERIKEFESPCSESDDIVACCSSMKELLELKMELVEKDEMIKKIQENNPDDVLDNAIVSAQGWKAKEERAKEPDQHNQLKLKFLRDAFFYFMIDFHSDEQIKAILAVLAYGDQREDVIHQAYRMRQRGKKFAVKEVSSRGLAFLHEES